MAHAVVRHATLNSKAYSRLFPDLPAWRGSAADIEKLAAACFVGDEIDNPAIPAGYTYFGQFMVHDLSFDARPLEGDQTLDDPNQRTPQFDLDCVYAGGPVVSPAMYDLDAYGRFLLRAYPGGHADITRNSQRVGIVGDPRNDENLITCQIHTAALLRHNRTLAILAATRPELTAEERFTKAAQAVRWAYHWALINDFLPRMAGHDQVDALLTLDRAAGQYAYTPRLFDAAAPAALPLEFSGAALRFGHAMVRGTYRLRNARGTTPAVDVPLFALEGPSLRGGQHCTPALAIDWPLFFDVDGQPPAQRAQRIAPHLAGPLAWVPGQSPANLALRNLIRGTDYALPAGQDVARAIGATPVRPKRSDPLWFYILAEANEQQAGQRLGEVGAAIVAGTIIDILVKDPTTALNVAEAWSQEAAQMTAPMFVTGQHGVIDQAMPREPGWATIAALLHDTPGTSEIAMERAATE
ncbi:peroxidase family protein [Sphingomonas sp.]|uniref:peroxidase family protein n=1 Tax=Sphingomonas sp. TaxID=28214 RepID=UPI0025E30B01|nr:peroxidase family protein [Sphingomonas sp.]